MHGESFFIHLLILTLILFGGLESMSYMTAFVNYLSHLLSKPKI